MQRKTTRTTAHWRTLLGITTMLVASTAMASVSHAATAPSTASCASVLDASDFTYKGAISVHGGVINQNSEGLAYRKSTNTWFTIAHSGQKPFELLEISLPSPHASGTPPKATVVKNWGPLNINGALDIHGSLVAMKGLFWDDKENKLWFTMGSFYANGANNNVIGYATLDTGKPVVHGPWKVSVHSDLAKGMLIEAPADMQAITHQRFLMFGVAGSTMQDQSWGDGLVSVAEPGSSDATGSALPSEKLIHWPMHTQYYGKHYGTYAYSDFPPAPGDVAVMIKGNDNVGVNASGTAQRGTANTITLSSAANFDNPAATHPFNRQTIVGWYVTNLSTGEQLQITGWNNTTKIATVAGRWKKSIPVSGTSYQLYRATSMPNIILPVHGYVSEYNDMAHASWIELPSRKCGLVYFGNVAQGYIWYGNPDSHNDTTPAGLAENNNMASLLHPGQPVHSDNQARGDHAEAHGERWYIVDPNAVLSVAKKAMAGTATAQDMQILWSNAGDVATLGGNVPFGNTITSIRFGESYWDAKDGLLYVLVPYGGKGSTGVVEVWQVQ